MTCPAPFFSTHGAHPCLWDIVCVLPDWNQLIYGCYFRREVAQKEVESLRKQYPRAKICVAASEWTVMGPNRRTIELNGQVITI